MSGHETTPVRDAVCPAVSFFMSKKDYTDFYASASARALGANHRQLSKLLGIPWLVTFAGLVLAAAHAYWKYGLWSPLLILLTAMTGMIALLFFLQGSGAKAATFLGKHQAAIGAFDTLIGEHWLEPGLGGVAFRGPSGMGFYLWRTCKRAEFDGAWVAVNLMSGHTHPIPLRVFVSEEEAKQWVAAFNALRKASGEGDAQMLARFLEDRDAECVKCGYCLRGLSQSHCPECGTLIDLDTTAKAYWMKLVKQKRT